MPDSQYTGGRITPGISMNVPAYGFGPCGICGQPILTSDTIVFNDSAQVNHAACLHQQDDAFQPAMRNPEIRSALDQIIDGINKIANILEMDVQP